MLKKLDDVGRSVRRAHQKRKRNQKHLRPTAVAIITRKHPKTGVDEVFMVYSRNSARWGLVKGGIDEGEATLQAAYREVAEEVGWKSRHLNLVEAYAGSHKSYGSESGRSTEYVVGKYMHCVHFVLRENAPEPKLNAKEGLVKYRFVSSRKEFDGLLMKNRYNLWLRALAAAGVSWAQGKRRTKKHKKKK